MGLNTGADPGYLWGEREQQLCVLGASDEDHMNTVSDFFPCEMSITFDLPHNYETYLSLVVHVFRMMDIGQHQSK